MPTLTAKLSAGEAQILHHSCVLAGASSTAAWIRHAVLGAPITPMRRPQDDAVWHDLDQFGAALILLRDRARKMLADDRLDAFDGVMAEVVAAVLDGRRILDVIPTIRRGPPQSHIHPRHRDARSVSCGATAYEVALVDEAAAGCGIRTGEWMARAIWNFGLPEPQVPATTDTAHAVLSAATWTVGRLGRTEEPATFVERVRTELLPVAGAIRASIRRPT